MQLSKESIAKFQKIYQDQFGISLSDAEAEHKAKKFLRFFKLVVGAPEL
jgi:hypothetical protein